LIIPISGRKRILKVFLFRKARGSWHFVKKIYSKVSSVSLPPQSSKHAKKGKNQTILSVLNMAGHCYDMLKANKHKIRKASAQLVRSNYRENETV